MSLASMRGTGIKFSNAEPYSGCSCSSRSTCSFTIIGLFKPVGCTVLTRMFFSARALAQDPGVGEDEIDATEFRRTVGDRRLQPFEITDVTLSCHDATAGLLDQIDGLIEILRSGHRIGDARHLFAQ